MITDLAVILRCIITYYIRVLHETINTSHCSQESCQEYSDLGQSSVREFSCCWITLYLFFGSFFLLR